MPADPDAKLAELLLIVAEALEDEPAAGAMKVNKILFFAEFAHVRETGQPITGVEYQRLPQGPAPRRLRPIRAGLIHDEAAALREEPYRGYTQHRLVALRPPDWDVFSDTEQRAIKSALSEYKSETGTFLSDISHEEPAWDLFEDGEIIPFAMAFATTEPPGPKAMERAQQLARRYGTDA